LVGSPSVTRSALLLPQPVFCVLFGDFVSCYTARLVLELSGCSCSCTCRDRLLIVSCSSCADARASTEGRKSRRGQLAARVEQTALCREMELSAGHQDQLVPNSLGDGD
jgi:hypothetical protein